MKINISTIKSLLYIAVCVLTLYACKKTEDAPPLPENRMLQFTVTNTSDGAIQGVINDKDSTITVYIPYYTSLLSLLPQIKIPDGATVTPASNTLLENWPRKQAMDSAMTYTVKAKNGSTMTYQLRVDGQQPDITVNEFSKDPQNPVIITHYPKQEDAVVGIGGDNLVPNAKINFITLVDEAGKGFVLVTPPNYPISYKNFTGAIPPDPAALPSGKYYIRVTSFSKTIRLKNPLIIKQITK